MASKYYQLSLKDTFSDCQDMFIDDTPSFFTLLDEFIDLDEFIPDPFLSICKELRDFCGFSKVPDAPLFTRFKQDFLPYI